MHGNVPVDGPLPLFVMFEVTLVPGYFIVAGYGGPRRNYAAMKFFHLHLRRICVPVRRDPVARNPHRPGQQGPRDFRPDHARPPRERPSSRRPSVDLRGVRHRFRREDPTRTAAQLASRYLYRSVDVRVHGPGRDPLQTGRLRIAPSWVFLLPRGAADLAPLLLTMAAVGITYGALVTIMQKT